MSTVAKRAQASTHPTVWIGLALAVVGLLLAAYSYTGTRIYDITYAFVALGGGLLALAGILVSAWGRSIMAARAQRARRAGKEPAPRQVPVAEAPPTVAAPAEKKRFGLAFKRSAVKEPAPSQEKPTAVFAFRRRDAAAAAAEASAAPVLQEPPLAEPALERLTLKCPQCATTFTAEGMRPFTATCPDCGFAATL